LIRRSGQSSRGDPLFGPLGGCHHVDVFILATCPRILNLELPVQRTLSVYFSHLYHSMVRVKPDLFLTVPNALESASLSRADLITPPCYIISAPPPLVTPALSRSSSVSTAASQSDSDCELDDDEDEVSLRIDAAPWTQDQDHALLSVSPLNGPLLITDIFSAFGWHGPSACCIRGLETTTKHCISNLQDSNSE
jgi:hypothetical protein